MKEAIKSIFQIVVMILGFWVFRLISGFEFVVICLLCNIFYWQQKALMK